MSDHQRVLDVSGLPTVVFGHRSLPWWATAGFMVIEGFTLLLMAAAYFYLRLNEYAWPPEGTPDPDLLIPTINTLLLLGVIAPMIMADRAARRFDHRGTTMWMLVATALTAVTVVLRWWDFEALNVRWDQNAYASVAWGVLVLHATLLLTDLIESAAFAAIFLLGHAAEKHYSDISDAADYQYFLSLVWVPLYVIVYWSPRFL
jgi:cytochrome c oxidase subunit III